MFLNIFLQFILYIQISLADINPIKNYYSMTFYGNFNESPKKITLESNIEKFTKILFENNSENKKYFELCTIASFGDLIKIDFSNIDIDNTIEFAFIIKMEDSKGNNSFIFDNQTNIQNIETSSNLYNLNNHIVYTNLIQNGERIISFIIPKIYHCKNDKIWLGKNELININFTNYFNFSLDEKIEINSLYIKEFIGLGKLTYSNNENVNTPINIFSDYIMQFQTNHEYSINKILFSESESKKEICTFEIYTCNETCRKCEIHEICEECIDGYYLFDSKCYKIVNDKNKVVYNSTAILQIYNLNINNYNKNPIDIFDENSKIKPSIINLNECINQLIDVNYISKDENIIIVKEDNLKENNYNDLKYFLYDKNGKKININLLCDNKNISISYILNDNNFINLIKDFHYMPFDKKDDFFINWCNINSINNNDITLEDRNQYFYKRRKICENCIFNIQYQQIQ